MEFSCPFQPRRRPTRTVSSRSRTVAQHTTAASWNTPRSSGVQPKPRWSWVAATGDNAMVRSDIDCFEVVVHNTLSTIEPLQETDCQSILLGDFMIRTVSLYWNVASNLDNIEIYLNFYRHYDDTVNVGTIWVMSSSKFCLKQIVRYGEINTYDTNYFYTTGSEYRPVHVFASQLSGHCDVISNRL